jgi:hypothetical protein
MLAKAHSDLETARKNKAATVSQAWHIQSPSLPLGPDQAFRQGYVYVHVSKNPPTSAEEEILKGLSAI